jgi:hypothetical protein
MVNTDMKFRVLYITYGSISASNNRLFFTNCFIESRMLIAF